jgi:COP9 signalosome complex subunit 7
MEQTRAINALAPFLALSKSATSARAAADLVTQATSATHTYVFGELLQTPNMQSLRDDPQYSNYYTLLELFAWGTWAEYQGMHLLCLYTHTHTDTHRAQYHKRPINIS